MMSDDGHIIFVVPLKSHFILADEVWQGTDNADTYALRLQFSCPRYFIII